MSLSSAPSTAVPTKPPAQPDPMPAPNVIDFSAWRARHVETIRRAREDAFDRELARRLAAILRGEPIPVEPIRDNPYIDAWS